MKFRSFEPGEQDLPEGWDLYEDRDEQWEAICELMVAADDPRTPPKAAFEAVRLEARRQLLDEGALKPGASAMRELGFLEWCRQMLMGGGIPAQAIRFALIGGVAFSLGIQSIREASAPTRGVGDGSSEMSKQATSPSNAAHQTVAEEAPETTDTRQSQASSGGAVEKSIFAESNKPRPEATTEGWDYQNSMVPVGAAAGGTREITKSALTSQMAEGIQELKMRVILNQDEQLLRQLNRIERPLADLMRQLQSDKYAQNLAMECWSKANQLASEKDYEEAIHMLQRTIRHDPGSKLALTAQLMIGSLAFDHLNNYDLALSAFEACMNDYPEVPLSGNLQQYLSERVQVLNETKGENWKSLDFWQQARKSRDRQNIANALQRIVDHSESTLLTVQAAQDLKELMINDIVPKELDANSVADSLESRAKAMGNKPEAAKLWFYLAEITGYRLEDSERAAGLYRRALSMQPSDALVNNIGLRLSRISRD